MPLNDPDCRCPFPLRTQVGNNSLGREVKYYLCCAITALEKITGEKLHEVMYDIEPGETKPSSGPNKAPVEWPYFQRIISEKKAAGFEMKDV